MVLKYSTRRFNDIQKLVYLSGLRAYISRHTGIPSLYLLEKYYSQVQSSSIHKSQAILSGAHACSRSNLASLAVDFTGTRSRLRRVPRRCAPRGDVTDHPVVSPRRRHRPRVQGHHVQAARLLRLECRLSPARGRHDQVRLPAGVRDDQQQQGTGACV